MPGKVWGRDVFVLVVAFVVMFGHADKLTWQMRRLAKKYFAAGEALRYDAQPWLERRLHVWLHDLRGWMCVMRGGNHFGLPSFDEDDGGNQDENQGDTGGDDDRQKAGVAFAIFGGGIAV
jgi:hypothetical protein